MPTPAFTTDELLRALSQTVPQRAIRAALKQTAKRERRRRSLPSALVVQLVIALGLLMELARRQVLSTLRPPTPRKPLPTRKSISRACLRVGARPLIALIHKLARPLAQPKTTPQAFHHGLRLVVLDGSGLDLPDSPTNERAFGRTTPSRGQTAFPFLSPAPISELPGQTGSS